MGSGVRGIPVLTVRWLSRQWVDWKPVLYLQSLRSNETQHLLDMPPQPACDHPRQCFI